MRAVECRTWPEPRGAGAEQRTGRLWRKRVQIARMNSLCSSDRRRGCAREYLIDPRVGLERLRFRHAHAIAQMVTQARIPERLHAIGDPRCDRDRDVVAILRVALPMRIVRLAHPYTRLVLCFA